jgi:hypothetical protein
VAKPPQAKGGWGGSATRAYIYIFFWFFLFFFFLKKNVMGAFLE